MGNAGWGGGWGGRPPLTLGLTAVHALGGGEGVLFTSEIKLLIH